MFELMVQLIISEMEVCCESISFDSNNTMGYCLCR